MLNRAWLVVIALAAVLMVPIWLVLWTERVGWRIVLGVVAGLALTWYFSPSKPTDPHR